MYKMKIVCKMGEDIIRSSERGNRIAALRTFSEARALASNGAIVKVTVRAPNGRVTKHTFRGKV
jgi:hypothetical protein